MDFSRLTNFLDSLSNIGIPGCDMAVSHNGQIVFRHNAGFQDREAAVPFTGDELYFLYSVSKVITCTAAMTLYEKGAFLLDDPVAEYLPGYRQLNVRHRAPNGETVILPARETMTMRHLFTMSTGLNYDLQAKSIQEAVRATEGRAPTVRVASALAQEPLAFEPGSHFLYSLSHDVLAAVVEVISGERFSEYVKKHIFEPCGMNRSGYHLNEETQKYLASQYRFDLEQNKALPIAKTNGYVFGPDYDSGGAGMISCVDDCIKFAAMMAAGGITPEGERILSRRTIDLMRSNQLTDQQFIDFNWPQFRGYGYGLGVRTMLSNAISGSPGPRGEFGWGGAAGAYILIDPEDNLAAYYAQHMLENKEPYVHPRLRNIIYSCLD